MCCSTESDKERYCAIVEIQLFRSSVNSAFKKTYLCKTYSKMFSWFIESCPDRSKSLQIWQSKNRVKYGSISLSSGWRQPTLLPLSRKPCVAENSFDVFQGHLVPSYWLEIMISCSLTCSSSTSMKFLVCPIMRLCPVPYGQGIKKQLFYRGINLGHQIVRLHPGWM